MQLTSLIDNFRNWRERRVAIGELRRLKREEEPFQAYKNEVMQDAIKAAAFCEDPEATVKAFNQLQTRAPIVAISSGTAIRSLLAVGKIDLAESVIKEGLRKFPGTRELMQLYAGVAQRRTDWPEASRRWKAVLRMFPGDFWGYLSQGVVLTELKRFDEAEKLLKQAISMEPLNPEAAGQYAAIAERRGDQKEALRRWALMRERIEDQAGWVKPARLMCQIGREDEAIELLTKARWRFQSRPEPVIELAQICHRRGLYEEAALLWQAVRQQFPQYEEGFIGHARTLRELGRQEEAEAVLRHYADIRNPSPGG